MKYTAQSYSATLEQTLPIITAETGGPVEFDSEELAHVAGLNQASYFNTTELMGVSDWVGSAVVTD